MYLYNESEGGGDSAVKSSAVSEDPSPDLTAYIWLLLYLVVALRVQSLCSPRAAILVCIHIQIHMIYIVNVLQME